jgi:hypothetical protein
MNGNGKVVGMYPNDSSGAPLGIVAWKGPEHHEICSSAVLGRARKAKGEHLLPFATRENERADARLYVQAMPQMPCKATGFYVGGETFTVEDPEIVLPGQYVRLEIPDAAAKKIASSPADFQTIACGILASVERWSPQSSAPSTKWKLPIGAHVVKEQVASRLTIAPHSTVIVQWQPEVASRFKRFVTEIVGDKDALHLNDFRFGKDSLFLSSAPVPLSVVAMPGALEIPDIVVPGIIVTASISNHSDDEVILGGGIVFENVEDELLALQKKYEEETAARAKAAAEASTSPGQASGWGPHPSAPGWEQHSNDEYVRVSSEGTK